MTLSHLTSRIGLCLAIAGAALITACGGGSDGNPSNPYDTPLTITTSEGAVYPSQPFVLHIHGGKAPYYLESSSMNILPVPAESDTDTVVLFAPPGITEVSTVVISVWDKQRGHARAVSTSVSVHPSGLYSSSLTVKPTSGTCASSGSSSSGDSDYAQICAGGNGVAQVQLGGVNNVVSRQIQFRVIQGDFLIQGSADVWQTMVTEISDVKGMAQVGIKVDPNVVTQVAKIRATEVATGNFIDTTFMIVGQKFSMTPDSASWTTTETTCAASRTARFYLYGGTPPYSLSTTLGTLSPQIVNVSGGSSVLTVNECGSGKLTARDSSGEEKTATITYTATGSASETTTVVSVSPIGNWGSPPVLCSAGSSFLFRAVGGSGTYSGYVLLNGATAVTDPSVTIAGTVGTVTFTAAAPAGARYSVTVIDDKGQVSRTTPQIVCQ